MPNSAQKAFDSSRQIISQNLHKARYGRYPGQQKTCQIWEDCLISLLIWGHSQNLHTTPFERIW